MPFSNATTGVAAREPEIIVDSPFDKPPRQGTVVDGCVVDRAGNRYQITACGHWTGGSDTCRHGCES